MTGAQERLNTVATRQKERGNELAEQLEHPKLLEFIGSVAPGQDPLGLVRVAYSHVKATPALARCSVSSIVRSVAEAAKLGLTVDGVLGHAYLVPYGSEAKMLVGFRGFVALGYESEKVTRWHWDTINENDTFQYAEGVDVTFRHERALDGRGEVIGAYAIAHLSTGGPPLVRVMGLEEIHARRARSASFKSNASKSPWTTDYEAMAQKCPVRDLAKRLPLPKLQAAALRDEAREEDRDDAPSVIDLGPDEVTVTDDTREREPGEEG
jgi:recombination protein RecT